MALGRMVQTQRRRLKAAPRDGPRNTCSPLHRAGRSLAGKKKEFRYTGTGEGPLILAQSRTLIKTEYWDRAGGGVNISYDW